MTFRSGFVSLVGRPNVGKSTLVNRIVGTKVAIVSARPQTTRTQIRGVRTTPDTQIVLLDTPGIHKPRTMLGERTNARARSTLAEVDVVCMLVDATAPIGRGDRFVADLVQAVSTPKILVVSKTDIAAHAPRSPSTSRWRPPSSVSSTPTCPLSGLTGQGVDALVAEIEAALPGGPVYYPNGEVTDQPETFLAAELLREKLLLIARDELPHSIAVVVEEIEPGDGEEPGDDGQKDDGIVRLRALILVERDSQKGIVIGKGGAVLKEAGTRAREELEALLGTRVYLQTQVKVERDWQRRAHSLDRLGF